MIHVGMDFGTSQCAIATATADGIVAIPLDAGQPFLMSCLYSPERSLICDRVAQSLSEAEQPIFKQSRQSLLKLAANSKRELQIAESSDVLSFGSEALAHHIADPAEGYFIKSPKSFLGASGLRADMVDFFEDVVTAIMLELKHRAEQHLQQTITGVVIGRPVNFQGINVESSNLQAENILRTSARRAGFPKIEFLYEPLAAGFDFERRLQNNRKVLVVDIGGGTSDCSMVLMGPDHRIKPDRREDFLAHTGERIGGNDFDIRLALQSLMPEFGLHSVLKTQLPMPVMPFVQATAINDVAAQSEFYSEKTRRWLEQLLRDTSEPGKLQRFIDMRESRRNFSLVNRAERAKITLSDHTSTAVDLADFAAGLQPTIYHTQLVQASAALLEKITHLVQQAIAQAQTTPDLVYLTGGSAKSQLVKNALTEFLGADMPLVDGDYFGSVATGLGVWAQKIWSGE
jgi:hypothetical chaperone protein